MEIFANIADTASLIFANGARNVAQAQMGIAVTLFILATVMMFIGWRFGSTRLLVSGATIIITGTGVILFGQNIQDIGTNVITFATGIALQSGRKRPKPGCFCSGFWYVLSAWRCALQQHDGDGRRVLLRFRMDVRHLEPDVPFLCA